MVTTRIPLRKTKVIATIGPACDNPETLAQMFAAGMNVARLNMSHGDHASHAVRIDMVRRVAAAVGANVALMIDTKGVEIRTGKVRGGMVELLEGEPFTLYMDKHRLGDEHGVAVSYSELVTDIAPGAAILIDDGNLELVVREVDVAAGEVRTEVVRGGRLRDTKGVNLPGVALKKLDLLSPENVADLQFAVEYDVDYIAASFVNTADDVHAIRSQVQAFGGDIPIIAKIETALAVQNLAAIVEAADGTMVARGDLGVELPIREVPSIQKRVIRTTVTAGKPVITATQMLDSMERHPKPTRAEVSDVANAIWDGTSAVMLSGESAVGKYPVEAVRTMAALALEAERHLAEYGYLQKISSSPRDRIAEAVGQAAVTMAAHLGAAAILTLTESGFTSRTISKYRPTAPILAITKSKRVQRRLALNWGITAMVAEAQATPSDEHMIRRALAEAKAAGYLAPGDLVVCTVGIANQPGSTNMIKVVSVD